MKEKFNFSLLKQLYMKFLFLAVFSVILFSCGNTFYVVRHAEKVKMPAGAMEANDPPLSDSGNLRAITLKDELKGKNIKYIFSTGYKRTIATAKPLDEYLLNVQTQIYNPKKDSMDAFYQKVKAIKKGNVLIVGHSNTVDDIANALAGKTIVNGDLKETDYDNIFIIKRKGNKMNFKRITYGAPTE